MMAASRVTTKPVFAILVLHRLFGLLRFTLSDASDSFYLNPPLQLEDYLHFLKIVRGIKKLENQTLRHVSTILRFDL